MIKDLRKRTAAAPPFPSNRNKTETRKKERKKKKKSSLRGTPEEGSRTANLRKPEAPASRRESRGRSPQGKEVWS